MHWPDRGHRISFVVFRCAITGASVSVSLAGCLLTALQRMDLPVFILLVRPTYSWSLTLTVHKLCILSAQLILHLITEPNRFLFHFCRKNHRHRGDSYTSGFRHHCRCCWVYLEKTTKPRFANVSDRHLILVWLCFYKLTFASVESQQFKSLSLWQPTHPKEKSSSRKLRLPLKQRASS